MVDAYRGEVVLASGNAGKLSEFMAMFAPLGIDLRPQSDWQVPEAIEDGLSFLENAILKARNAARHTSLAALADDSGLVVPALGGAPGIHSARYAGGAGDQANNQRLLADMTHLEGPQRKAFFHCTLVMMKSHDDPVPLVASANWWGSILHSPMGEGGFGYDPLFAVDGMNCSSAQLLAETKNRLSHRGQALQRLVEQISPSTHAP